ncbi:MAG: leucine-rich repeat domain-containing protein [Bacteroidaceae bacterium]|nr:leucine-rich repeat domain-containing protein [Bacteroidaceae bacterium]
MKRILFFLLLLLAVSLQQAQVKYDLQLGDLTFRVVTADDGTKSAEVFYLHNFGGYVQPAEEDIIIPATIEIGGNAIPVTRIIGGAFTNLLIRSIQIPNTVTTIDQQAFLRCKNLVSVQLPDGLSRIAEGTFEGCLNLKDIDIPASVTTIGARAFHDCLSLNSLSVGHVRNFGNQAFELSGITSVHLSKSAVLGKDVFRCCLNLQSIVVEDGNPLYDSRNDCNAIIESATGRLLRGCNNTIIPNNVKEIGDAAFLQCQELESADIPEGCTRIGEKAFFDCSSLQSVTLPEGLTSIGKQAFCACDTLSKIHLPASLTSLGDGVFMDCLNLREMTIPESITVIPNHAFFCCRKLSDVQLPSTLRNIGESAFACCHFTSIDLPSSVRYIGPNAFQGCDELTTITLPDSLTSISERTFVGCPVLQDVTLPEGLQSVGKDAFSHSYALKNIIAKMKDPFPFGQMALYSVPKGQMTLYIPEGTRDAYTQAGWLNFIDNVIEMTETGIQDITSPSDKSVNSESETSTFVNSNFLDLSGRRLPTLPTRKGIYIKDGRKVLIK